VPAPPGKPLGLCPALPLGHIPPLLFARGIAFLCPIVRFLVGRFTPWSVQCVGLSSLCDRGETGAGLIAAGRGDRLACRLLETTSPGIERAVAAKFEGSMAGPVMLVARLAGSDMRPLKIKDPTRAVTTKKARTVIAYWPSASPLKNGNTQNFKRSGFCCDLSRTLAATVDSRCWWEFVHKAGGADH
jgi:hypothetical protein